MIAHLARMIGQAGAARLFVVGFECIEESLQRRLGVDHDILLPPGSFTTRSGRNRPLSPVIVSCSAKSQ